MAKIVAVPQLKMMAQFEVTEAEARFLDGLFGYGGRELVEVAMQHLGTSYIEEHRDAGIRFVNEMRPLLAGILKQFDDARAVFHSTPAEVRAALAIQDRSSGATND